MNLTDDERDCDCDHLIWDTIDPWGHGRPEYYSRAGEPMTMRQWGEARAGLGARVAETHLAEGAIWISTVWLGMDHRLRLSILDDESLPLIFETMVFGEYKETDPNRFFPRPTAFREELGMWRYSTEEEALAGHARIVEEFAAGLAAGLIEVFAQGEETDG